MPEAKVETNLQLIGQIIPDPVFIIGPDGTILDINAKGLRKYGFKKPDLLGKNILELDFIPPETKKVLDNNLACRLQGKKVAPYEVKLYTKSGDERYFEVNGSLAKYGEETVDVALLRDITERKRAEKKRKPVTDEWETTFNSITDLVSIQDNDFKLVKVNQAYADAFNMKPEELIGKTCYEVVHGTKEPWPTCPHKQTLETKKPVRVEFFEPRLGVYLEVSTSPIFDENGEVSGSVHITKDITERKQAEEALRESESKFKSLAEQSPSMIYINKKGRVVYTNKKSEEITGYKREEFYSPDFDFLVLIAPESIDLVKANFSKHMKDEEVTPYECTLITKEGKRIEVIQTTRLMTYEGESAILGIITDITERKQAEEELEAERKNLEDIIENVIDGIGVSDVQGKIIQANKALAEMHGYDSPDKVIGKTFFDFVAEEELPRVAERFQEMLTKKEKTVKNFEMTNLGKDGCKFSVMTNVANSWDKDGNLTRSFVVVHDITERKQLEQELRESEERYRSRLDNMMEGCQIIDFDWRYVYVNEAMARQGRTTKEKLLGHTMMEVYPDIEQTAMFSVLKICMEKRQSADIETKFQFPDGEKRWSELRIQPVKEGIFILSIDITERKRLEELSTTLANSSQIGVYIVQERKFQFVNPQFQKYSGFSQDELVGINPLSLVHREDRERVRENAVKMLKGEPSVAYEFRVLTKGGQTKWIQETVTPITYKGKRAVLGSFMDITERKRMEERLLRLNYTLLLIRKINQLIVQADNESELLQRACAELVDSRNYKLAWIGFTTKDSYDVLPVAQEGFEEGYLSSVKITWDDSELGRGSTGTAIKTGRPFVMQDILNDKRFQPRREEALKRGYASKVALPLIVEGKVIGALNVYSGQPDAFDAAEIDLLTELAGDISVGIEKIRGREKRAKAEKALYQSEQMLHLMFQSISDGLTVTDLNGVIFELNPRTLQMHGFSSRDELLGRNALELIIRHEQERAKANMQKTLEQGFMTNVEYTLVKKDGSEFPGELSASLLKDASGKAIGFITTTRDITERKRSEEQLKEAYEAVVMSMVLSLEARDTYTKGHSDKVKLYCRRIALQVGLLPEKARELEWAASLHDIGKIAIPDAILNKPGRLTIPEFTQIQLHPEKSVDLLRMIPHPKDTLLAVRYHHERVDGKGYPDGLTGNNIPICARILAVADAYDALTSERSYRKAFSHEDAIETLKAGAGTQWDAKVVEAAIKALGR